jgi:hypothetical protein
MSRLVLARKIQMQTARQVFPFGHPSARQLQNTTAFGEPPTAAELVTVELHPGDVLCLPAYWLHEVETLAVDGDSTPAISLNAWRDSDSTLFGRPSLFFAAADGTPLLATPRELRTAVAAVVGRVLPHTARSVRHAFGCSPTPADDPMACVSGFFSRQLALRWAPLLDLGRPDAAWGGCEQALRWPIVGQLSSEQRDGVDQVVRVVADITPRGALPTILMDWAEAVCYGVFAGNGVGDGIRDCPWFFAACLVHS